MVKFFTSSGVAFGAEVSRTTAMKRIALLFLVVAFGLGACERHEFKETRKLHDHHDGHSHDQHEKH
jgi:hypothetical protein